MQFVTSFLKLLCFILLGDFKHPVRGILFLRHRQVTLGKECRDFFCVALKHEVALTHHHDMINCRKHDKTRMVDREKHRTAAVGHVSEAFEQ